MVRSLPLRTGFFPTPQLSAADESELLAWGRSLVPEVHRADAEWTLVHEKKGVQLMEDRQKGGLSYSVRGTATVHASLDDLMDLFLGRAATTADFRALMQLQLRETFADAAVLYHREQNESETLGVKWVAMRPKKTAGINLGSSQGHDFCLMEYAGVLSRSVINGPADQQLGVCLYESVDQRECTLLTESHRIERGSITRCGYLFLPIAGGVEAQFVCSVRQPPNQRSTRRLNRAILQTWAESVGALEEAIGRKRISRELTQRRMPNWVSDKDRACCHLCLKTFTNTRRKHHCRACGEIICRACSMYKAVDLQSVGLTTLRVCKACMDGSNAKKSESEASDSRSKTSDAPLAKDESLSQSQALALPNGVNDATLRDAVEEYALALPNQLQNNQAPSVPDLVGLAWLRQLAERDPSKKEMVAELMENLRRETEMQFGAPFGGPVGGASGEQVDIYDTLCDLAAQALACKYAVVSLVDENRQWFKSAVNVQEAEVPRDFSFCEYPVRDQRPLVVMDTLADPRFRHHPFVTGPLSVRFLAGAPLFTVDNQCVGAVCVLDTEPRDSLQESQLATMQNLAHLAMVMVQERREAQARIARAAASQQLVPARNVGYGAANYGGNPSVSTSSDLVPLSSYAGDDRAMVVQTKQPNGPKEDPVLKEQMIQLLHKASQVRDQVTQQSQTNKPAQQQAGLQSSAE